jgi:Tfp pilus assembly PilM family ATPase
MKPPVRSSRWLAAPPPTVAIEIASRRVTVAEVSRAGGPVVSAFASEALPADAVAPALAGVNIAHPDLVTAALGRALEQAGLRSTRRAALSVPDSVARVSLISLDQVPARQSDLDQLVRWHLRKATPFPIDEAQISYFPANAEGAGATLAAVVARSDVIAEYEAVATALGVHTGIVDLASFNVMNAVIGAGGATTGDWLLVCLAAEATTLAILRGQDLLFYRHRAAVDEEPLSALVHQTAMYHEDRLGGGRFARVWLSGAALLGGASAAARREIADRLSVPAEAVDIRPAAGVADPAAATPDVLDALAAPVGVLLRDRKAA